MQGESIHTANVIAGVFSRFSIGPNPFRSLDLNFRSSLGTLHQSFFFGFAGGAWLPSAPACGLLRRRSSVINTWPLGRTIQPTRPTGVFLAVASMTTVT